MNQLKSQGKTAISGPLAIDTSIMLSLVGVAALVVLVGGIGGLLKQGWAKNLALGAASLLVLLVILQGNVVMAVIIAVVALVLFFAK